MAMFSSGVSGGVAVSGQTDGISLTTAGDYALLLVSNAVPPGGPDASATITLSGAPVGATISIEKQYTNGGTATALSNLRVEGSSVDGDYSVPSEDVDMVASNIAGLYSITVTLVGITSGTLLVEGQSTPGNINSTEAAQLAALTENNTLIKAQVLASSYEDNVNYFDAAAALVLP